MCHLNGMARVSTLKNDGRAKCPFSFSDAFLIEFLNQKVERARFPLSKLRWISPLGGSHHCRYVQSGHLLDMTLSTQRDDKMSESMYMHKSIDRIIESQSICPYSIKIRAHVNVTS